VALGEEYGGAVEMIVAEGLDRKAGHVPGTYCGVALVRSAPPS
jgi:hypothetical protein